MTVIREKKYLEYLALAKKQKKSFLATVIHDMYNNKVLDNGRNRNNSLANGMTVRLKKMKLTWVQMQQQYSLLTQS